MGYSNIMTDFDAVVNGKMQMVRNIVAGLEQEAKEEFQNILESEVYAKSQSDGFKRKENGGLKALENIDYIVDEGTGGVTQGRTVGGRFGSYLNIHLMMMDFASAQGNRFPAQFDNAIESGICMGASGARPFYITAEKRITELIDEALSSGIE